MKKIIAVILALLSVACIFSACGNKENVEETDKETTYAAEDIKKEDGYSYVILEDGTAKIIGFNSEEKVEKLNMPSKFGDVIISCIGKGAFQNNDKIHAVYTPKYITDIEEDAFAGSSIHNAFMSSSRKLITIHKNAFANCPELIQADISSSVEKIEAGAFENCTILKVLTLRGNVTPDENAITAVAPGFALWTYKDNADSIAFGKANGYEIKFLDRG